MVLVFRIFLFKIKGEMYSSSNQKNKTQPNKPPTYKDYSRYFLISSLLSLSFIYKKNIPGKKFQEENPDFKLLIKKFIPNFGIQQKSQLKSREG